MARINNLENFVTDLATAIKAKAGISTTITPANFDTIISEIDTDPSGDGNITANDVASGKIGYAQGERIVGTYTPLITQEDYDDLSETLDAIQKGGVAYTELDEMRSFGKEYINTNYIVKPNTNVEMELRWDDDIYAAMDYQCVPFGCREHVSSTGNQNCYFFNDLSKASNNSEGDQNRVYFFCGYYNTSSTHYVSSDNAKFGSPPFWINIKTNAQNCTFKKVDGNKYSEEFKHSNNRTPQTGLAPLLIFGCNQASTNIVNPVALGSYRVRFFKIYEGATLVKHFVPARDRDGVICMLEKIEGKLYYSPVGEFAGGKEIVQ